MASVSIDILRLLLLLIMKQKNTFENKLRFDVGVEDIKKISKEIMEKTKKVLDEVAAIPVGDHTFNNTIKRIADQEAIHSIASTICTFPSYPPTSLSF